jgi:putative hydroxymethylpyrimidine transport system substrate-binding protein
MTKEYKMTPTRFLPTILLALTLAAMPVAARAADKLTLLLDWFVNPDHGPLVVAQEQGFFAAQGLEVEMVAPADPNDPPKLVAAGQADIAVSYQPQLHLQAAEGLPLKRIGTLVGTPLNSLVVLADGPVKSLADLKGRNIGFSVGGFEDALLRQMLGKYGVALDDVTLINVNFALSQALLSGQVDAVIGAFRNFELNQLDIEGRPGRAFYPEEEGVPAYDELIFVAHKDRTDDPSRPRRRAQPPRLARHPAPLRPEPGRPRRRPLRPLRRLPGRAGHDPRGSAGRQLHGGRALTPGPAVSAAFSLAGGAAAASILLAMAAPGL